MSEDRAAKIARFNQNVQSLKNSLEDEDEQDLLTSALWLVWLLTAQEEDLAKGFDVSFTPDQADLILTYSHGGGSLPAFVKSSIRSHLWRP
jgi:hypothetical protein